MGAEVAVMRFQCSGCLDSCSLQLVRVPLDYHSIVCSRFWLGSRVVQRFLLLLIEIIQDNVLIRLHQLL